jgi:hypothetical protein
MEESKLSQDKIDARNCVGVKILRNPNLHRITFLILLEEISLLV